MQAVRIAIVDPHELSRAGFAHLLGSRHLQCELSPPGAWDVSPDVVLYGMASSIGDHDPILHDLLRRTSSTVVVTHWDDTSASVETALACGAHGAASKRLPVDDLIRAIDRIVESRDSGRPAPPAACRHPGIARCGLTGRELEVLGLVVRGLTNQEIADRLYLSINSVKSYIRTAYQKVGVQRRSQAVLWAERHGLTPPPPVAPPVLDEVAAG